MSKKINNQRRVKNPTVLKELVGGDRCTLDTEHGPMEVQVGFKIGDDVFVRVRDSQADQLLAFEGETPFVELTYQQPGGMGRSGQILDEVDPVFGMSATSGDPILRRN